jgi:hypothetical protein
MPKAWLTVCGSTLALRLRNVDLGEERDGRSASGKRRTADLREQMAGTVVADAGTERDGLRGQQDGRVLAHQTDEMACNAVLLAGRRRGLIRVGRQPVLAGVVDDRRAEIRVVPVIGMQPGPEHRRDERHHEQTGHKRPPNAISATEERHVHRA